MKNERGSALLTVVLIAFVTVIIGVALSSFVIMNYKLGNLENRISKAEYEAEKIVDTIYLAIQRSISSTISNSLNEAREEILADVYGEMALAESNISKGILEGVTYKYGAYTQYGTYQQEQALINQAVYEEFKKYYLERIGTSIKTSIYRSDEFETRPVSYDVDFFGKSGITEIAIDIKEETKESFIETFEVYYTNQTSPTINFTVKFDIGVPLLGDLENNKYKLNQLVRIIDLEIQDWGYL